MDGTKRCKNSDAASVTCLSTELSSLFYGGNEENRKKKKKHFKPGEDGPRDGREPKCVPDGLGLAF
jgi:hypothetical protein